MPFSFNLRNFGRWNPQPVVEKPISPASSSNGLAPPYTGPGGPEGPGGPPNPMGPPGPMGPNGSPYYPMQPMQPPMGPQNAYMPAQAPPETAKSRINMTAASACCLFVTVIFIIMVEIGNTHNKPVLRDIWFMKLHFANISPAYNNTPGLGFGIAESLGLYDFYQIGLWNYAEGWNSSGIQYVSPPTAAYWWNPVDMFGQQIAGYNASSTFAEDMTSSLHEIEICSKWMFGLWMTGACLSFVLIPIVLIGIKSKWFSLGLSIITFLNMICVLAATIIATCVFVLLRDLFKDYEEIMNLVPEIGATMFAMMWIGAAFSIFAFLTQVSLACFFRSSRDIRMARNPGKAFLW